MRRNEVIDLQTYFPDGASDEDPGANAAALAAGTSLLRGQYNLKKFLAAGGFGITYLAQDSLMRDVVVKECFPSEICLRAGGNVRVRKAAHSDAYQAILEGFVAEAHSLAALDHRNIVRVHQVFKENSTAYMAIDFVAGPDLFELIELPAKRPSPRLVRGITRKLLDAVQYIHARGMLHLDISPDNILMDGPDEPVLIDFGAARDWSTATESPEWHSQFVKDGYSPPEFYDPDATRGASSDLYSLAASIHHLISGDPPLAGDIRRTAVTGGDADPYIPLLGRVAGYDPEFLDAIDRCLQIDPNDRIQSAEAWTKQIARRRRVAPKRVPPDASSMTSEPDAAASLRKNIANRGRAIGSGTTRRVRWAGSAAAIALGLGGLGFYLLPPAFETRQTEPPSLVAGVHPASEGSQASGDRTTVRNGASQTSGPPIVLPVRTADPATPFAGASGHDTAIGRTTALAPVFRIGRTPARPVGESADTWALVQGEMPRPAVFAPGAVTDLPSGEAIELRLTQTGDPAVRRKLARLFPAEFPGSEPRPDTTAPTDSAETAGPIIYAHWDVEMPFRAETSQVRKAHTAMITEVSETANLNIAGDWIREGAVIYAFNGAPLRPNTALSSHILNALAVDPDGFTRSIVQYRDPELGTIDRGLLAVPVVRRVGLIDGTALEFRYQHPGWQVLVREPGASERNTLSTGDVVLGHSDPDAPMRAYDEFETVLYRADELGLSSIELTVLRNGKTVTARIPIDGDFQ